MPSPVSSSDTVSSAESRGDFGGRHQSSLELASGVDVCELPLHDVSNGHLAELVRMAQIWRRQVTA